MMIAKQSETGKKEVGGSLVELAQELEQYARQAAADGESLHAVESKAHCTMLELGRRCVETFLALQGDGDLGETITTEEGQTLYRSKKPESRPLRTIFGEHEFFAYVYAPGPKKKIALRPIDARMSLPEGKCSYLLQEFSQYFCVEQAFGKAQQAGEKVLGQKLPVDTLEAINQRMAKEADAFVEQLPKPAKKEEGELLVLTTDGKGVPMIRDDAEKLPAFCRSERRGTRRMAMLAGVYSVDRYMRSAEEVVAALFRDEPEAERSRQRPRPCHKRLIARFAKTYDDGDQEIDVSGAYEALTWAASEVRRRRQPGQPLLRLCDGQESLWDASAVCLEGESTIDILDIVHVSQYVWLAANALCPGSWEQAEAFARDRLLRILKGEVKHVVAGMRQIATKRKLKGKMLRDVQTACGYFEKNAQRMRYDEYLAAGYPIATGVIEGACRHLVKDRMERSGMRWRRPGAESMLALRALHICDLWDAFQQHRIKVEQQRLHRHRHLLRNYQPLSLAF